MVWWMARYVLTVGFLDTWRWVVGSGSSETRAVGPGSAGTRAGGLFERRRAHAGLVERRRPRRRCARNSGRLVFSGRSDCHAHTRTRHTARATWITACAHRSHELTVMGSVPMTVTTPGPNQPPQPHNLPAVSAEDQLWAFEQVRHEGAHSHMFCLVRDGWLPRFRESV